MRVIDGLLRRDKPDVEDVASTPRGTGIARAAVRYGHAAFSWGMRRGAIKGNPFANLPVAPSVTRRDRVLTDKEIAAVWRAAGRTKAPYGAIVQLLVLTGQRRDEVSGATWGEISEDLVTWTLPATRTKNAAVQIVPLSEPAQTLLRGLLPDEPDDFGQALWERRATSALIFPGKSMKPFSGWSKAKAQLDVACGVTDWRLHDLRRSVATNLQKLGTRLEVTEAVLNHISGSRGGIVGIYQRHDWSKEKSIALSAWADHLVEIVTDKPQVNNVLKLVRA